MNELRIFESEEFGKVRVVEIDGEPWFVGKDVATILGYSNSRDAIAKHVDEEDRGVANCDTLGGSQEISVINESGLYSLIFGSKLINAKRFKHWVTSEVIPSIRKNGGYIIKQEELTPEQIVANALIVAQNIIANKEKQIEELQPKADYFDQLVDRNLLTNFRDTAKEIGIKQKIFITYLENHDYIYRDSHGNIRPYADKNKGLFELKEFANGDFTGVQTLVTPRGRETFRLLLADRIEGEE